MKAQIKLVNRLIEVEGDNQKDLFAQIAGAYEVFGESKCGLCKSENIKPVVRTVPDGKKSIDFYEYQCLACLAKLQMGQSTDTESLFPKRKLDKNGRPDDGKNSAECTYGDHNGWSREWLKHVKNKQEK